MIDKNKKYHTKDGRAAIIDATDRGGQYPVHGAIVDSGGWRQRCWTSTGVYDVDSDYDGHNLVEVADATMWPKDEKMWRVKWWRDGQGCIHQAQEWIRSVFDVVDYYEADSHGPVERKMLHEILKEAEG